MNRDKVGVQTDTTVKMLRSFWAYLRALKRHLRLFFLLPPVSIGYWSVRSTIGYKNISKVLYTVNSILFYQFFNTVPTFRDTVPLFSLRLSIFQDLFFYARRLAFWMLIAIIIFETMSVSWKINAKDYVPFPLYVWVMTTLSSVKNRRVGGGGPAHLICLDLNVFFMLLNE